MAEMAIRTREGDSSDAEPEYNQPGLGVLREAVARYAARLTPEPPKLRDDGIAGLTSAINNVPDGMANGLLVGVNPVYGLYATMMGPVIGGIFSSTQLMMITTTAAASLTMSQALINVPPAERANAMFVMVILVGVFQVVAGLLGLGRLIRFVSYSVTTGFLTGVSVLLILSQLSTITGYEATGDNRISQTFDLLGNLGDINMVSLVLAILALALAIVLPRTPIGNFGRLVAIIVPSVLVALIGLGSVQVVQDVSVIPRGIPTPSLPSLSDFSFDRVTGALAVAVVILVQGAGVSQSVPNPDGSRRSTSRDFIAQGTANAASGLFRGLPVGGSVSATSLNLVAGARTKWSVIFAGLWMAVFVVAFPGLVSYVAMPALGAMLILAGVSSIKPADVHALWNAGWPSMLAGGTTFLAMLYLPIQAAVGIGVTLSALLYVMRSSTDITIVEQLERPGGEIEERTPPKRLPSNEVTVLDVYGNLFYAGARTLERRLPRPLGDERHPVVVLRLRGRPDMGATLIDVLANYARKLQEVDGRLYLTGISKKAHDQVLASGQLDLSGPLRAYPASPILGQSAHEAVADARDWLASLPADVSRDDASSDEGASAMEDPDSR